MLKVSFVPVPAGAWLWCVLLGGLGGIKVIRNRFRKT